MVLGAVLNITGEHGEVFAIVIAWTEDDVEIVKQGRVDLGERHTTRPIKVARSCMWVNRGNATDLAKAHVYAAKEGHRVFTYPTSERDPRGLAESAILGK